MKITTATAEVFGDIKLHQVGKREGGEETGREKYWLVTLKIPCNAIGIDELPNLIGEELTLNIEQTQLVLDLKNKPARAPVVGEANAAAPMQKAEAKAA